MNESSIGSRAPLADVAGKTAFITGGSSGIGLGLARACLDAGMKVAFTWRRATHRDAALAVLGANDRDVCAIELDVTDRAAFARAADVAGTAFGNIHLLANNAGIGIRAGAAEATFNDWDWGLGVNLGGVVNGVATVLPRMLAHREGAHVFSTASTSGLVVGGGLGVYCTAKFAVVGMMESLRDELAARNIGVSVFCPGFVRTNLAETEAGRPPVFANDVAKPSTTPPTVTEAALFAKFAQLAMDPFEAGRRALEGIRRNELHILTHAEFTPPIRNRSEALLAASPTESVPGGRAMAARKYLTTVYATERDRRLQTESTSGSS
jgi:NAD(P)-dependent dehydrogenase (short-subunit alcohol dehydrogenase family)